MVAQRLSVVIPALNEAATIVAALAALAPLRSRGHEVIVADGGSTDGTAQLALGSCDQCLRAPRGRAVQMNAGARAATGDALLFLHADTRLPDGADALIRESLASFLWGRFDVKIEGRHPQLGVIGCVMNLRSRLTGIAPGDPAIIVRREAVAGWPEIALKADSAFCTSMKKLGPPACRRE
ncbi:MAG: glycosyltransferase, partial [Burkholderiales bacterium]